MWVFFKEEEQKKFVRGERAGEKCEPKTVTALSSRAAGLQSLTSRWRRTEEQLDVTGPDIR